MKRALVRLLIDRQVFVPGGRFCCMIATLFPYKTLFRSAKEQLEDEEWAEDVARALIGLLGSGLCPRCGSSV